MKFEPQAVVGFTTVEAAWGAFLVIEDQLEDPHSPYTREWTASDWQMRARGQNLANIVCEPVNWPRLLNSTLSNTTQLDLSLVEGNSISKRQEDATSDENPGDISVEVTYNTGELSEFSSILILRKILENWMKGRAWDKATTLAEYGEIIDITERGVTATLNLVDPGRGVGPTKISEVVDGFLKILERVAKDRRFDPFTAKIYKPGKKMIAQATIIGGPGVNAGTSDINHETS